MKNKFFYKKFKKIEILESFLDKIICLMVGNTYYQLTDGITSWEMSPEVSGVSGYP